MVGLLRSNAEIYAPDIKEATSGRLDSETSQVRVGRGLAVAGWYWYRWKEEVLAVILIPIRCELEHY
jgi:hypothetical protein